MSPRWLLVFEKFLTWHISIWGHGWCTTLAGIWQTSALIHQPQSSWLMWCIGTRISNWGRGLLSTHWLISVLMRTTLDSLVSMIYARGIRLIYSTFTLILTGSIHIWITQILICLSIGYLFWGGIDVHLRSYIWLTLPRDLRLINTSWLPQLLGRIIIVLLHYLYLYRIKIIFISIKFMFKFEREPGINLTTN